MDEPLRFGAVSTIEQTRPIVSGYNSGYGCLLGQLDPLKEKGYKLITATNGSDGLRLLMSRPVDVIVLEYHLGLLNGAIVSDEIKVVRLLLPIVMLTDHLELPEGTLKSVDALVAIGRTSLLGDNHPLCSATKPRSATPRSLR